MNSLSLFLKDHTFKMILIFSFLAIVFAVLFLALEWQIVEGGRFFKLTIVFAIPAGMLMAGSVIYWLYTPRYGYIVGDGEMPEEPIKPWGLPYKRLQIRYASGRVESFKNIPNLPRAYEIVGMRKGKDMNGFNKLKAATYYDKDHQKHDIKV